MVIDEPESPNAVTWILFIVKIAFLITGYIWMTVFLLSSGLD